MGPSFRTSALPSCMLICVPFAFWSAHTFALQAATCGKRRGMRKKRKRWAWIHKGSKLLFNIRCLKPIPQTINIPVFNGPAANGTLRSLLHPLWNRAVCMPKSRTTLMPINFFLVACFSGSLRRPWAANLHRIKHKGLFKGASDGILIVWSLKSSMVSVIVSLIVAQKVPLRGPLWN